MKKLSVMVGMMVLSGCGGASQLSADQLAQLKAQVQSGITTSGNGASSSINCAATDSNFNAAFALPKGNYQIVHFSNGDRLIVCQYQVIPGFFSTSGNPQYSTMSTSFTVYSPAGTNPNNECDLEYSNFLSNATPGAAGAYLSFTNPSSGVYQVTYVDPTKPLGSYVGNVYTFPSGSCQ